MRPRRLLLLLLAGPLACGDSGGGPAGPIDEGEPPVAGCSEGTLPGGALYQVCFPGSWNGDLVVYAHGYVRPDLPIALPDDAIDGVPVSAVANALGYAYATTSYRANGLVADLAVEDLVELDETVRARFRPDPGRTYIVGFSEGGLVAALTIEQEPEPYAGAIAACGPIGDFALQIEHFGDFRAVFDYYFPDLLPGSPVESPSGLRADWESVYVPAVRSALAQDVEARARLLAVTGAPVDPLDPETIEATVIDLLWYSVFATEDAQARLGGQPYDNSTRVYQGSDDDAALNAGIGRYTADLAARAAIERFQTSGQLTRPLVTLHTVGDPIVPVVHQELYAAKVAGAGAGSLLEQQAIDRYGHCAFEQGELLSAFTTLVGSTP
ncbi:MAG TPA: prolyl oligopeptidase family serine peptidase [Gemmatimonadales bacterium]|nr:prolyl oligopeptidase family serine peptidase [Gemmatimonadales bacterium]